MSDIKNVSPLLDGFIMGEPISDHDGVRCCPVMRENSDEKYIVKIISIPSSQKQLDALLLTGAYPDAAAAMEYFRELAEGVVKEAEVLKQLAKLQGFLPYESWQIVPMDNNRLGYEVYLLGPYKLSLEKYLNGHTMTHLGAVNLALDLCAALSICRRAGYMFVDLKPSNIFITGNREYRIGDLGFAGLDSLKFNALPGKYRSRYTPHELHDDLATLNPTADIHAVGMILYQIYNDGQLPFDEKAPDTVLPTPLNADYEMAEIIQKAIDPSPRKRWQTPIEMGQALVSYMQRNCVSDIPIVPPAISHDAVEHAAEETSPEAVQAQEHEELAFMQAMTTDETAPDAGSGDDLVDGKTSAEVSSMLAQADEILATELPGQVVIPEAPEITLPEPEPEAITVPEIEPDPIQTEMPTLEIPGEEPKADEPVKKPRRKRKSSASRPARKKIRDEEDEEIIIPAESKQIKKSLIVALVLLILLGIAGFGGYRFYNDYYLLTIDRMEINGFEDTISVFLRTDIDETLLTVVCTDTYGNTMTMPVVKGNAEFIGLNPGTMYRITVEVEGFHALEGAEPCSYTTSEQTKILDFTAKTGTEDGSALLSFTVDGRETQDWMIEYAAEGEEPQSVSFTGHMVTITGLTVGKTYTFNLVAPAEDLWIVGNPTLEFTASEILVAEKLAITGCVDGVLSVQWALPSETAVDSWTVRCYSDAGYDETITTGATSAEFHGILPDKAYTVEVTAYGMSQSARAYISANPTTVTKLSVEAPSDTSKLNINWEYSGTAPEGGWLLLYSINGNDNQAVISCSEPSAVIEPRIPGVTYNFTIQASDGSTVFKGTHSYDTVETDPFDRYSVNAKDVQASLCPTPEKENWTYKDIKDKDYTSRYVPGKDVSMVIYSSERPDASDDNIEVMFVIRDEYGNVLVDLINRTTVTWNKLWNDRTRYCALDIPAVPKIPGQYTVSVYFNSCLLVEKNLTILQTE